MPKLKILNETPLDFQEKFLFDNWEVSYLDLMEVNQGSPLVGSLSINGQVIIKEQGFGGPLLYFNRKIYIIENNDNILLLNTYKGCFFMRFENNFD